jgi:2-deoxy-D-gluconate 3-dehydrogenase
MNGEFRVDGKAALVTGGSQGLGLAMADALASAGANVAVVARSHDRLESAAEKLRVHGTQIVTVEADLRQLDQVFRAVDEAAEQLGGLDIAVTSAGTQVRKPALEVTEEDWERLHQVNLRAVFFTCQRAAKHMLKDGPRDGNRGKIINIASLTAAVPWPKVSVYGVTKSGVAQITKALAAEWGPLGICVNAIGPGTFPTELTEPLYADSNRVTEMLKRIPLGRWGEPNDLAGATLLLASPASDYITGQILWVDGGWLVG